METIDVKTASLANWDTVLNETNEDHYNTYYVAGALFTKNASKLAKGVFYIPKVWSHPVLFAVQDILSINHKVKFVDIKERNAKLEINLHYPGEYDKRIHERIWEVKNFIDKLVILRTRRFEVARKFHHDARPFY